MESELTNRRPKDFTRIEGLAYGAGDAINQRFAFDLLGKTARVTMTYYDLRGLTRKGYGGKDAFPVKRDQSKKLTFVRRHRNKELVALLPRRRPVVRLEALEIHLETMWDRFLEQMVVS